MSTGVLILVQASGGGDYWGEYGNTIKKEQWQEIPIRKMLFLLSEGVKAKVYIRASPRMVQGRKYLTLQQIKMDFSVKDIKMGVENVHGGNSVLRE